MDRTQGKGVTAQEKNRDLRLGTAIPSAYYTKRPLACIVSIKNSEGRPSKWTHDRNPTGVRRLLLGGWEGRTRWESHQGQPLQQYPLAGVNIVDRWIQRAVHKTKLGKSGEIRIPTVANRSLGSRSACPCLPPAPCLRLQSPSRSTIVYAGTISTDNMDHTAH